MLRPRYAPRIVTLTLGSTLAIALALAVVSSARGQGADVQIDQLDCVGPPEVVVIQNQGDATQDFSGWELRSDPATSEVFDLSAVGGLPAGASVAIQSGPSASGAFIWDLNPVFRDDDATDYVRIVTNTGAVLHQVNCATAVTLTPSPTPSPEPSPVGEMPNGGGPPPLDEGAAWPLVTLLIGGSIAVAGVVVIALPRLRLRPSLMAAASSPWREPTGPKGTGQEPFCVSAGLVLLVLAAAVVFRLLHRRGS